MAKDKPPVSTDVKPPEPGVSTPTTEEPKPKTEPKKDYTMDRVCAACGEGYRSDLEGKIFCPDFDKKCPRYSEEVA